MPDLTAASELATLRDLAIALIAGFLVGFEREWKYEAEGKQYTFAGGRTFALVGFVGGLVGVLGEGPLLPAAGFAIVGALTIAAWRREAKQTPGRGGTTEMAIFATFLLGLAAGRGAPMIAAAGAVVVAIVLSLKEQVVAWARALDRREIHAALRFLAIALLILPIVPDEDFGPYGALNPRELWTMVVLISGLSFLAYWLVKSLGGERGVLVTGIVGGLASSTATTLSLSRLARDRACAPAAAAAGIVMANVAMAVRIALILAAISREALAAVAPALIAAIAVGSAAAFLLWRRAPQDKDGKEALVLENPFELRPALFFAGVLAIVYVASAWAVDRFNAAGFYVIGLLSGLASVDAMTLSGGREAASGDLAVSVAAGAILLAAASNMAAKAAIAVSGGRASGGYVSAAFVASALAGAAAFLLV